MAKASSVARSLADSDLDQFEIFLAGSALGTGPVQRHVGPPGAGGNASIGITQRLVIDPAANQAHPGLGFFHKKPSHRIQIVEQKGLLRDLNRTPQRAPFCPKNSPLSPMPPALPADPDLALTDPDGTAGPACVLVFNASDPSGSGGLSADITAIASVGAHALPVVTGA